MTFQNYYLVVLFYKNPKIYPHHRTFLQPLRNLLDFVSGDAVRSTWKHVRLDNYSVAGMQESKILFVLYRRSESSDMEKRGLAINCQLFTKDPSAWKLELGLQ